MSIQQVQVWKYNDNFSPVLTFLSWLPVNFGVEYSLFLPLMLQIDTKVTHISPSWNMCLLTVSIYMLHAIPIHS